MSDFQDRTIQELYKLKRRGAQWHAVLAAGEVGIFGALDSGQKTVAQLAEMLSLNEEAVRRLMNVLLQTEMVEQYGEDFALTTLGGLIPASLRNFGAPSWERLVDHLKTGEGIDDSTWDVELDAREWTMTPAAINAMKCLDIGSTRKGIRILDLGCGSGVFGVAMAHRDPTSRITFLDTASQLKRAKETLDSVGIEAEIKWAECDPATELQLFEAGEPFDLIVVANRVHRMDVIAQEAMYMKLHSLLKPEGEMAIIDVFAGQEAGQEDVAIFDLESGLRAGGKVCDALRIEYSLKASGFRQVQFAWLPCEPHLYGLMLATR
ncbi:class I SAM-dependent methyltransferase [Mariniblastus fucicola]|uniref:Ubiquinone/menaquinone biosynthesis methyltransferase n=1 Tax=Mariniblastus fucicola TaxID=980251 RepID=A0A5B9PQ20_9BACT|nr:class I SAM-dependent methyltransferase [Mariniblastus fucicola]QEG24571.1 ubiquinone/menaquinone biosynthesis methyltransferase [Mariniblastus fucicola]